MKPDRKQQTKPQREVHPPVRSKAEDAEPATGTGGLPIFVFILLGIGIYFSMVYLDNHAGGFNAIVPRGFSSSNELTQLIPFDPAREGILKGQRVYSQTCFACHLRVVGGGFSQRLMHGRPYHWAVHNSKDLFIAGFMAGRFFG